jgi:tetratricopeptide (TPR) repeat protein
MRQKFEDLRVNLDEFIQQTDYSLLLVSCRPEDCAYIARFLDGQDAARPESFFIVWPGPFVDASRYVTSLVQFLKQRLEEAKSAREERGDRPFPAPPLPLEDELRDPALRFREWLEFLVTLLDDPENQSFVVGLLPNDCQDAEGYARLVGSVLPIPSRPAWLEPLRIVAFDSKEAPQLVPLLDQRSADSVLTWEVDFSTPALTDALAREASNPSLPLEERMMSTLQLAGIDCAYQRHAEARAKFALLYDYYAEPPQPTMQAICLHGAGESLLATGENEEGKRFFERALALCMRDDKAFGPMLIILQSLIRVCFLLQRHAEAESYAKSGGALAAASLNPSLYAYLEELRGDAQRAQNKSEAALQTYEHARKLAEVYELQTVWKSVLDKLVQLHSEAGRNGHAHELQRERQRVESIEGRGAHAPRPAEVQA